MATKTKTKPAARPRKTKAAEAKPTRESLLQGIATCLKEVDHLMVKRPSTGHLGRVEWLHQMFYYGESAFIQNARKLRALQGELDTLLQEERGVAEGDDAVSAELMSDHVLHQHFTTPPGEALQWSRPGSMVVWLGDIPVRVQWGGFLLIDTSMLFALDPCRMFFTANGADTLALYQVESDNRTPEALIRSRLADRLRPRSYMVRGQHEPPLVSLDRTAVQAVRAFQVDPANAWWAQALRQSPADAIPLPANLPPVQRSFFS